MTYKLTVMQTVWYVGVSEFSFLLWVWVTIVYACVAIMIAK